MHESSDFDFLEEFERGGQSFDHYMDLKELLEEIFKFRVDLVLPEALKERLREEFSARPSAP